LYADLSIRAYLEKIHSGEPVPGGGSVSALAGALGAGLAGMVAGLTAGRKGFDAVDAEIQEAAATAANLLEGCLELVDKDPEVYRRVLGACNLPQNTAAEKTDRRRAIREAMEAAVRVPLLVAERSLEILGLAETVVRIGISSAAADGVVGALLARSAGLGALYNVRANLKVLESSQQLDALISRADALEAEISEAEKKVLAAANR